MTDTVIVLDSEVSLDSIFSAAGFAVENATHIIVPTGSESEVENEWTFETEADLYICDYADRYRVLSCLLLCKSVKSCLFIDSTGGVESINICLPKNQEITCLDEFIRSLFDLSKHRFIKDIDVGLDFYTRLKFFLNETAAIKTIEREILQGKSKLSQNIITQKASATAMQLLGLDEFKFLEEQYVTYENRHEGLSEMSKYYSLKSSSIKGFYSNSFTKSGNLVKMSSFPVAYKYLSVFLYLSAQEMLSSGNYSSSYIMFFRCFEVYCEGLILSQSIGKIEKFVDEYNNVFEDCFIIPNRRGDYYKPMGFGGKWKVIRRKNLTNTMNMSLVKRLEHHMEMRNVNVLTHGDVFASSDLLRGLVDSITDAIVYFEDKFAQTNFHWRDLRDSINKHFLYDPRAHLGKTLLDEYDVKSIKLQ